MANNIDVKDAAAATVTMKTTDNAGVHTAHHNVDSSALPTGAATEATLATLGTETTLAAIAAALGGTITISGTVTTGGLTDTQLRASAVPVSAASLPLPTGAATETTLASALTALQLIDNIVSGTGVNISQINGVTPLMGAGNTGTGALRVDLTSNGSGQVAAIGKANHDSAASGAPVLNGGYASAAAPANVSTNGDVVRAWHLLNGAQATVLTAAGALIGGDATNGLDVDVTRLPALPAGTNNIGDVDVLSLPSIPAGTNNIGGVTPKSGISGGLSIGKNISAASTNATSLKGSAGQVYTIYAHNINAAVRYLKLYNKATAPTVGTDTPVLTLPIPAAATGNGFVLDTGGIGIEFTTGIAYALTTGIADSDTGAVAANEIAVTILYK